MQDKKLKSLLSCTVSQICYYSRYKIFHLLDITQDSTVCALSLFSSQLHIEEAVMKIVLVNNKKWQPAQISIHKAYALNQLSFLALLIMVQCPINNVLKTIWKKYFEAFLK